MTTSASRINWDDVRERLARSERQLRNSESIDRERLTEVFRRRARLLAQRRRRETAGPSKVAIFVFRLGDRRYGIELRHVEQVFSRVPLTPIPGQEVPLLGVAHLNGSLRSVIDLRPPADDSSRQPAAGYVVLLRSGDRFLGLWAETLENVSFVNLDMLTSVDDPAGDLGGGLIRGMTDQRVKVLDVDLLLNRVAAQSGGGGTSTGQPTAGPTQPAHQFTSSPDASAGPSQDHEP